MIIKPSLVRHGLAVSRSLLAIKVLNRRIPLYCEWEVTDFCNMTCDFCSTLTPNRNNPHFATSTEEALQMITQLAEMGTKFIHFSGGEPSLRKDLPELITKAKEYDILVSLTTNGYLTKRMKKFLHADLIRISLDGVGEIHNSMRNTPGAYKKALETIEFLLSHNKKPLITTVFTEDTSYERLKDLVQVAKRYNIQIAPVPLSRKLSETELNEPISKHSVYTSLLCRLRKEYGNTVANPEPYLTVMKQGGLDVYGCRAMDISISIKADGSVNLPCTGFGKISQKGNLKDIYYSPKAEEIRSLQGKHPVCEQCSIRCMASASAMLKFTGFFSLTDAYIRSLSK